MFELPALNDKDCNCTIHGNDRANFYVNGNCIQCANDKEIAERDKYMNTIRDSLREKCGIPKRFKDARLEKYIDKDNRQSYVKTALSNYKFDRNLVLLGTPGTGKTYFGCALVQKFIDNFTLNSDVIEDLQRRSSSTTTVPAIYSKFYDLVKEHPTKPRKRVFEDFLNIKFLVIDEIGSSSTDGKSNSLFEIIDKRYDEMLPTMLISNFSADEFKQFLSAPMYSRIVSNFVIYDANWEDYRIINRKDKK